MLSPSHQNNQRGLFYRFKYSITNLLTIIHRNKQGFLYLFIFLTFFYQVKEANITDKHNLIKKIKKQSGKYNWKLVVYSIIYNIIILIKTLKLCKEKKMTHAKIKASTLVCI